MIDRQSWHRPLMAGLYVEVKTPGIRTRNAFGTLSGLATSRRTNNALLATCLHVVTVASFTRTRTEEMYQNDRDIADHLVARMYDSAPVSVGVTNSVDLAVLELESGVDAEFEAHNPAHDLGMIVSASIPPRVGMTVHILGAISGVQRSTVFFINQGFSFQGYDWYPVMIVLPHDRPLVRGDSGAPILYEDSPGIFRMCGVVFASNLALGIGFGLSAHNAESELEFFFGDNSILLDRNPNNLGLPLLNQEGFLGRRFIIDDYFKAGEDLMAGDAVGINPVSESDDDPTLFRMDSGTAPHSLIGIVHTPWSKSVGDLVASVTDFVPVVVQGIAKARASLDVGVGDSVTPETPQRGPAG